jgi:hypothetical protein
MSDYFQISLKYINEKMEMIQEGLVEEIPRFQPHIVSISLFIETKSIQLNKTYRRNCNDFDK